jgi:glutamyl-tRNA synthetase
MYEGKLILRFDDTNPEKEHIEFYENQKKDLEWLGIKWDVEICTSQHMPKLYELAEQMIHQGDCYICNCPQEQIGKGRYEGIPCKCRDKTPEENMAEWKDHLNGSAESILRLKGDMKSQNTAMRDPTMFRVIEKEHPMQGKKYRFWPTYDFAGSIMDSISGVTHAFRTKEYELRDEVYFYVLDKLKLRKPTLMEFARLAIEGMPISKRLIKPLIDEKKVSGYDDPRLPTLRGLKRRGIVPEAIKQFVLSQGKSKSESTITFDQVEAFNRKTLDPISRRAFFVPNPVMVAVDGAENAEIKVKYHPEANLGERVMAAGNTFYIPKSDADALSPGETFRFKDLYNVTIVSKGPDGIIAKFAGKELLPNTKKVQWVSQGFVEMEISVPKLLYVNDSYNPESLESVRGYVEPSAINLPDGEILQFERFGFVRIERQNGKLAGIFTHK